VFGSYPQQQPDLKHSPTYCSILVNDDARPGGARLSTLQGRPGRLESASRRGYLGHTVLETLPSSPDFVLADTQRGAVFMQVDGSSVLQEAHVGGGHLRIETCGPLKRWGGDGERGPPPARARARGDQGPRMRCRLLRRVCHTVA